MDSNLRGAFSGVMAQMVALQLSAEGRDDEIPFFIEPEPGPPDTTCEHCGKTLKYKREIDDFGLFVVWNPYPEPCDNPECVAIAKAEAEAKAKAKKSERERRHREIVESIVRNAGVPRAYLYDSFGTYDTPTALLEHAKADVMAYVQNFRAMRQSGRGLYLAGNPGTGKTHLAVAVVRALAERELGGIIFTSSMDLLDRLKQSYDSQEGPSEAELIEEYKNAPLLVIDDLGKEYGTVWAMGQLSKIIHARYAEDRPMIITSNFALDDIGEVLAQNGAKSSAQAIQSRLCGCVQSVSVIGSDYRTRQ